MILDPRTIGVTSYAGFLIRNAKAITRDDLVVARAPANWQVTAELITPDSDESDPANRTPLPLGQPIRLRPLQALPTRLTIRRPTTRASGFVYIEQLDRESGRVVGGITVRCFP